MIFQIGENPEFTFAAWFNVVWWSGGIALPLSISWWNTVDSANNRNVDVTIRLLCFAFSLEIWFWRSEDVK